MLSKEFRNYLTNCEGQSVEEECVKVDRDVQNLPEFAVLCYANWNLQKRSFFLTEQMNRTTFGEHHETTSI